VEQRPTIEIIVNGEPRQVAPQTTVADLVAELKLTPARLAIELNLAILPRSAWAETCLQAGDRLEIVHFVGGGSDHQ
jgi:thiamine biosynthesis protein ThiS